MKRIMFLRISLLFPLILILVMAVSASSWLPINGIGFSDFETDSQQASTGSKQDIVRVDIAYKTAAASASKVIGYKLTGVKWLKLPVQYAFNSDGQNSDMNANTVKGILIESAEVWDDEISTELFKDSVSDTTQSYGDLDGTNTIAFGDLGSSGTIAVTSYWYIRKTREIVEFDMCFNTYYTWGDAKVADTPVMDIQNIATHEFGHAVGMADIYLDTFNYVTMYGYSDHDDIIKRDLADPDIDGLLKIYGK